MNEVRIARQESDLTLYFAIRNGSGQVYDANAQAFAAIDSVTWSNATIALSEQGTSGDYFGTFPSTIAVGEYTIEIFEQVGASPVRKDDTMLGSEPVVWRFGRLNQWNQAANVLMGRMPGAF